MTTEIERDTTKLQPGQMKLFECDDCSRQFAVLLEPSAITQRTGSEIEPATVHYCPFCAHSENGIEVI